jgi:hypothetical protein
MNRSRLGCFTPSGLIAAALTIIIVAVVMVVQGGVLFNPGPLNAEAGSPLNGVTSHAAVGGDCSACHAPFWDSGGMAARCTGCHTEIAVQLSDPQSSHSVFLQEKLGSCRTCHPDHRGPGALQTVLDTANFPHEKIGFPLIGKHGKIACSDCHDNDKYSRLPTDCYSCHAKDDPHKGLLGTDCFTCHTSDGWVPSLFDHSAAAFKLVGKHNGLLCTDCHADKTFAATPSDCYSCHAKDDPHQGQLGIDCALCHTPAGWKPSTFDHNTAAFILDGKHVDIPCTDCHINGILKGTPTDCFACHAKDDPHKGHFGTFCAACHATSGWKPPTFDHNRSAFPLTGAHAFLECIRCHPNYVFKGEPTFCAGCHGEPFFHAGVFGTDCAQCHTTSDWSATYNGPHPGGCEGNCINHQGASCRDCHTVNLSTATCTKCHGNGAPGGGGGGD